jgi:cytochrome c-type biogenesis protein CcmH/NrfG
LLTAMAMELHLAKKAKETNQTVSALEAIIRDEVKQRPADAAPLIELARLYMSEPYGKDYAKAAEALAIARRIDPACDPSGALAVHCLYKLNRHREALDAWRTAQRAGGPNAHAGCYGAPTLFYAALAASGAGEKELGQSLARQAVHMYPSHALAVQTRELIK